MVVSVNELAKHHKRNEFDCGVEPLNTYLRRVAKQHTDKDISRTYVLTDDLVPDVIIGFFTLTFCDVKAPATSRPAHTRYPFPLACLRLARLAVDVNFRGQGFGEHLLITAINNAISAHAVAPLLGLFVDSKDASSDAFYERYGFQAVSVATMDDAIGAQPKAYWLPIGTCIALIK